jgi:excisionase family DNA binding protein
MVSSSQNRSLPRSRNCLPHVGGEGVGVKRLALSVAEAAAVLGVSKDAIYDAVRCHELPAIRIRRRILIPLAALEQLMTAEKPS